MSNKSLNELLIWLIENRSDWTDKKWKYILVMETKLYVIDWEIFAYKKDKFQKVYSNNSTLFIKKLTRFLKRI